MISGLMQEKVRALPDSGEGRRLRGVKAEKPSGKTSQEKTER